MSWLRIRWPKYWRFSFSISPSNEYSGLISFRIDWFNVLSVQGTLKSLLKHHNSKSSLLQCSAFFTVQLSHLYMTFGKSIALTIWTFDWKVMPLLFNTKSRNRVVNNNTFLEVHLTISRFSLIKLALKSWKTDLHYCFQEQNCKGSLQVFWKHLTIPTGAESPSSLWLQRMSLALWAWPLPRINRALQADAASVD